MAELNYDITSVIAKDRDHNRCQFKVTPGGKKCNRVHFANRACRIDQGKPDYVRNLIVMCDRHYPDWE